MPVEEAVILPLPRWTAVGFDQQRITLAFFVAMRIDEVTLDRPLIRLPFDQLAAIEPVPECLAEARQLDRLLASLSDECLFRRDGVRPDERDLRPIGRERRSAVDCAAILPGRNKRFRAFTG